MDKPAKSLADYMAIAISPVLIMALVGSLVFFLLEVIYRGRYQASLQHILFCFVFGAVLVARISMQAGISERAGLYGIVLGLATWLALLRFVEYPEDSPLAPWSWAISLGLIAIIWWSAHRLTWDCTLIDDEVDASGTGLLESAGLEKPTENVAADLQSARNTSVRARAEPRTKNSAEPAGFLGWLNRYQRYRDERRRQPHTPGVWVVYFSLAALPLFGLGQAQIPPGETARRQYTFQLMCVYVGSGLGLLLATSFLGLRRYLRQRNLRMPAGITTAWLSLGVFLIAIMLGLGALLPRPADSHPVFNWPLARSTDLDASRFAQVGDGKEKRKGETASKTQKAEGKGADGKETSNDGDKAGDKDGQGKASGKNGRKRKQTKGGDKSNDDKSKDGEKKEASNGSGKEKETKGRGQAEQKKDTKDTKAAKQESKDGSRQQAPPEPPGTFMSGAASFLKWIVIGVLVLLVVFFLMRSGLRFLANFTNWAQRLLAALQAWWQGLGALWQKRIPAEAESGHYEEARPPSRPFSAYPNPFLNGHAERMSPGELVRYSFEALEAWAGDQGLERREQETPIEFTHRLGDEVPPMEKDATRLAGFYASLAYARVNLPDSCREPVRQLWKSLKADGRMGPVRSIAGTESVADHGCSDHV